MGKFDTVFKSEIARLTRREMRPTLLPLLRQVRSMSRQVRVLAREVQRLTRVSRRIERVRNTEPAELSVLPAELDRARMSAGLLKKLRNKLGLTQGQLAALVGVSAAAVQSWEQNIARPGESNKATIVALRKLGRREVGALLQRKGIAKAGRKPRTATAAIGAGRKARKTKRAKTVKIGRRSTRPQGK